MSTVSDFVSGAFKVLVWCITMQVLVFVLYILKIAVRFLTSHVLAWYPLFPNQLLQKKKKKKKNCLLRSVFQVPQLQQQQKISISLKFFRVGYGSAID